MIATIPAKPALVNLIESVSFVEFAQWLIRWIADAFVALMLAPFRHRPAHRRHWWVKPPATLRDAMRPESGADEEYVTELIVLTVQHADDREFGLLGGDLIGETAPFDLDAYLDAWPAMPPMFVDATEVALTGGTRQLGCAR